MDIYNRVGDANGRKNYHLPTNNYTETTDTMSARMAADAGRVGSTGVYLSHKGLLRTQPSPLSNFLLYLISCPLIKRYFAWSPWVRRLNIFVNWNVTERASDREQAGRIPIWTEMQTWWHVGMRILSLGRFSGELWGLARFVPPGAVVQDRNDADRLRMVHGQNWRLHAAAPIASLF